MHRQNIEGMENRNIIEVRVKEIEQYITTPTILNRLMNKKQSLILTG